MSDLLKYIDEKIDMPVSLANLLRGGYPRIKDIREYLDVYESGGASHLYVYHYDEYDLRITPIYRRPENDEERSIRIKKEKAESELQERSERDYYEKLKKKFE